MVGKYLLLKIKTTSLAVFVFYWMHDWPKAYMQKSLVSLFQKAIEEKV